MRPGPDALLYAQDKLLMRAAADRARRAGAGLGGGGDRRASCGAFLAEHGGRAVVKTAARRLRRARACGWSPTRTAPTTGSPPSPRTPTAAPCWWRSWCDFRRELAQSVARRPSGEIVAWPVVESVQRDGVCAEVIAPAPSSGGKVADAAADIAYTIAERLGVTGVLAVELFETTDERLLVNELAMRPHNTGHWSIDGSTTSQFEQHLRAVLDLPLGATGSRDPWSVMINVFGGPPSGTLTDRYPAVLAQPAHGEGAQLRQAAPSGPQGGSRHRDR